MIQLPDQNAFSEKYYKVPNSPSDSSPLQRANDNSGIILREREKYDIDYECMQQCNTWEFPSRNLRDVYPSPCPTEDEFLGLNIALCDWGLARFTDKQHINAVAPLKFKSPEMLIGVPWDQKTDIWTLGTQLVLLMTGRDAFWAEDCKGCYSELQHLWEMELDFGSFPRSFLDRGHTGFVNAHFNYGGEVWLQDDLVDLPPLDDRFTTFNDEDDKEDFINMLRHMMRIEPEKRSSAAELLKEPWLQDVVLGHEIPKTVKGPLKSSDAVRKVDSVIDSDSVRDSDSEHDSESVRDLDLEEVNSDMDNTELEALVSSSPKPSQLSEMATISSEASIPLEAETTTPLKALLLIGAAVMMACPMESLILVGLGVAVRTLSKVLKNI